MSSKCRVYIGNLPQSIDSLKLRDAFQDFGEIKELCMKRGYAFIVCFFGTV
jgi:RNA recognition motif-containing protein